MATVQEFAAKIRNKYPGAYDDFSDIDLTNKILKKYPEYSDMVDTWKPETEEELFGKNPIRTGNEEEQKPSPVPYTSFAAMVPPPAPITFKSPFQVLPPAPAIPSPAGFSEATATAPETFSSDNTPTKTFSDVENKIREESLNRFATAAKPGENSKQAAARMEQEKKVKATGQEVLNKQAQGFGFTKTPEELAAEETGLKRPEFIPGQNAVVDAYKVMTYPLQILAGALKGKGIKEQLGERYLATQEVLKTSDELRKINEKKSLGQALTPEETAKLDAEPHFWDSVKAIVENPHEFVTSLLTDFVENFPLYMTGTGAAAGVVKTGERVLKTAKTIARTAKIAQEGRRLEGESAALLAAGKDAEAIKKAQDIKGALESLKAELARREAIATTKEALAGPTTAKALTRETAANVGGNVAAGAVTEQQRGTDYDIRSLARDAALGALFTSHAMSKLREGKSITPSEFDQLASTINQYGLEKHPQIQQLLPVFKELSQGGKWQGYFENVTPERKYMSAEEAAANYKPGFAAAKGLQGGAEIGGATHKVTGKVTLHGSAEAYDAVEEAAHSAEIRLKDAGLKAEIANWKQRIHQAALDAGYKEADIPTDQEMFAQAFTAQTGFASKYPEIIRRMQIPGDLYQKFNSFIGLSKRESLPTEQPFNVSVKNNFENVPETANANGPSGENVQQKQFPQVPETPEVKTEIPIYKEPSFLTERKDVRAQELAGKFKDPNDPEIQKIVKKEIDSKFGGLLNFDQFKIDEAKPELGGYYAFFDQARFKEDVNSKFGQKIGDQVIAAVSKKIGLEMDKANNLGYHVGGDEFLGRGKTEEGLRGAAEKLQNDLLNTEMEFFDKNGKSIGVLPKIIVDYGIGKDYESANAELLREKERAKAYPKGHRLYREPSSRRANEQGSPPVLLPNEGVGRGENGTPNTGTRPANNPPPLKYEGPEPISAGDYAFQSLVKGHGRGRKIVINENDLEKLGFKGTAASGGQIIPRSAMMQKLGSMVEVDKTNTSPSLADITHKLNEEMGIGFGENTGLVGAHNKKVWDIPPQDIDPQYGIDEDQLASALINRETRAENRDELVAKWKQDYMRTGEEDALASAPSHGERRQGERRYIPPPEEPSKPEDNRNEPLPFSLKPIEKKFKEDTEKFSEEVKARFGLEDFTLQVDRSGNLELDRISVPKDNRGEGIGSKAMAALTDYADKNGRKIWLSLADRDREFGTTSKERLRKFYSDFGFVSNRGRNKDYRLSVYAAMYRDPEIKNSQLFNLKPRQEPGSPEKQQDMFGGRGRVSSQGPIRGKGEDKGLEGLPLQEGADRAQIEKQQTSLFSLKPATRPEARANEREKVFYSYLSRSLEQKMPNSAPPDQIRGIIKGAGVKEEEIKWSGLDDFLAGKEKVSKADLLKYLEENQVQVQEVVKGEPKLTIEQNWPETEYAHSDVFDVVDRTGRVRYTGGRADAEAYIEKGTGSSLDTKFSQYQTPGGSNYRELLLTMSPKKTAEPEIPRDVEKRLSEKYGGKTGSDLYAVLSDAENEEINTEIRLRKKIRESYADMNEVKNFRSSHFDEPNILAHVRFNDRVTPDGKKVLFLEEIQSDLHQAGRKEGYKQELPHEIKSLDELSVKEGSHSWTVNTKDGRSVEVGKGTVANEKEALQYGARYFNNKIKDLASNQIGRVPDFPFKKTWHELALRRMLRYASENGYDRLAWTTGDMQAQRYPNELRKVADHISWNTDESGIKEFFIKKDGALVMDGLIDSETGLIRDASVGKANGKRPEEIFGKGMAEKVGAEDNGEIKGEDFTVGAHGMQAFYDKMIPQYLDKYGKKWGAKVEPMEINASEEFKRIGREGSYVRGEPKSSVQSIPITPSMRKSVMEEGQPLFSLKPSTMVERKVEALRKSEKNYGQAYSELVREEKETWASLEDDARKIAENWNWDEFKKVTAGRQLKTHEVMAIGARIKSADVREIDAITDAAAARAAGDTKAADLADAKVAAIGVEKVALLNAAINNASRSARALAVHAKLMEAIEQNPDTQFILKAIRELGVKDNEALKLLRIFKEDPKNFGAAVQVYLKTGVVDKILEYWKAGLLSGAPTHVANTGGNFTEAALMNAETYVSGGIDKILGLFDKYGERQRFSSEGISEMVGLANGFVPAASTFWKGLAPIVKLESKIFNLENKFERQAGSIKGKKGEFVRIFFKLLELGDDYFKTLGKYGDIQKLAHRKALKEGLKGDKLKAREGEIVAEFWNSPEKHKDIAQGVAKSGKFRTYQESASEKPYETSFATLADVLAHAKGHRVAAIRAFFNILFPFSKTPANIFDRAIERSPLGYAHSIKIIHDWRKAAKEYQTKAKIAEQNPGKIGYEKTASAAKEEMNRLRGLASDQLARATVGTVALTGVGLMVSQGLLTGSGPQDPAKRNLLEKELGWQPYAIKIDGHYLPLQRIIGAMGPSVGAIADVFEAVQNGDESGTNKLLTAVIKNLTDQSYLQGLIEFSSAVNDPKRYGTTWGQNMTTSMVPMSSFVRSVARATDKTERNVKGDTFIDGLSKRLQANIPFLSRNLAPKYGVTGNIQQRKGTAAERLLSPAPISKENTEAMVEKELFELEYKVPKLEKTIKTNLDPDKPAEDYQLNDAEFEVLRKARKEAAAELKAEIEAPNWKKMDADERSNTAKDIFEPILRDAKEEVKDMLRARLGL